MLFGDLQVPERGDQKRKGLVWRGWLGIAILLPALYVASFGPLCWLANANLIELQTIEDVYRPLIKILDKSPSWIHQGGAAWSGKRKTILGEMSTLDVLAWIIDSEDNPSRCRNIDDEL